MYSFFKKADWLIAGLICFFISGCEEDPPLDATLNKTHRFPDEVAGIFLNSCAVTGCHNDISREAAGGLSLTSWENLFKGSRSGAVIIPYRPEYSTLLYYINTYPDLGLSLIPLMPYGKTPLSREQVIAVRNWIQNGASNSLHEVKFASNPGRKKIYVSNQGCDIITVFDLATSLAMRYVNVGASASTESPHMIRVSPDNKNWYVVFYSGAVLQKYDAATDAYIGQVTIGSGSWNTFAISSDSKTAYAVDWNSNGKIARVDLASMTLLNLYQGFISPHGSALKNDSLLYVTAQTGNYIYKIDLTDPDFPEVKKIMLGTGELPVYTPKYDPHEIIFTPDKSKYFVTCQKTNEVRVMLSANDSLLAVIPTGDYPQELAISAATPYLFVSCPEDASSFPSQGRGSVAVINYQTHQLIKKIYTGYQPHGIAVDDHGKKVFVANRNVSPSGPPPHHTSACNGRNGNVTAIDMNTLDLVPGFRPEISVDPYSVAIRQ